MKRITLYFVHGFVMTSAVMVAVIAYQAIRDCCGPTVAVVCGVATLLVGLPVVVWLDESARS